MYTDLNKPITANFDHLYLDPNNPRLARDNAPGYDDPDAFKDAELQAELEKAIHKAYAVADLEHAVITQGWTPIDPIIVWPHPKANDVLVVVEGNTRTTVLRQLRTKLPKEQARLAKMQKDKKFAQEDVKRQAAKIERLEQILKDTDKLTVIPVNAKSPDQLKAVLPRILGVRHVTRAQNWSPYATNLYILAQYNARFIAKNGKQKPLVLESELIEEVADEFSQQPTITRRQIQAASAFSRFKTHWEDKLSEGDEFKDSDQYFFELILQSKFVYEQFGFTTDRLVLEPDMEKVLFQWAFKHPREMKEDSKNVLRIAEDLRLWGKLKSYDDKKGTSFASRLDVTNPDEAPSMGSIEADYLSHKEHSSPVDKLEKLIQAFGEVPAESLMTQSEILKPMLIEVQKKASDYLKMIAGIEG